MWRIGDWGGASEHIGRQWETMGADHLRRMLGVARPGPDGDTYVPRAAVIISEELALSQAVHRGGKPHADAILVGTAEAAHGDRPILEPVDFKWTLETAEPRQVGAEVLEALLADPPPLLAERVAQALAEASSLGGEPLFHSGIFLAPDSAPNRACLAPLGPLPEEMVAVCKVEALPFFSPLPGWEVALALAQADHARFDSLETTERYYRLGAGVLGALRRLASGIFADQLAELDGAVELARLRARHGLRTTGAAIAYLDRAQRARAELAERLKEIEGRAYPFGAFRREVGRRGMPSDDARRLGKLHGEIMKAVRQEARASGRRLISEGQTEQQALSSLETSLPRLTRLAEHEAERLLRP